jgi:hypothetical protein
MFQVWLAKLNCPLDCRDDSVYVLPCRLSAHAQPTMVETGVADPDPGSGAVYDLWIRDGKNTDPGSGIRDEHPGSYF